MKKLILLSFSLTALFALQAVSIHVTTPGTLSTLFTASEKTTTTELTLTGNINASDVKCLRDEFTNLSVLNLSSVFIDAYNGNGGTSTYYSYPANEMPASSFFNPNTGGKKTLTSVHLPNSITSIGESAFCNCDELTSMTIPAEVEFIGMNAFVWCTKLSEYFVKTGSPYFSTKYGVLYNLNQTKLIQYPNGKHGECIIPATVTSIDENAFGSSNITSINLPIGLTYMGHSAFSYCTALTSITIPETVTSIEEYTFQYCSALSEVFFPATLKTIGANAFRNCTGLSGVLTIPNSVTSIGSYAFLNCQSLTGVNIGNSIKSIGRGSFFGCVSITNLTLSLSVTSIDSYAFWGCSALTSIFAYPVTPVDLSATASVFGGVNKASCTLYIPIGSKSLYQNALQWMDFANIVESLTGLSPLSLETISLYPNPVTSGFRIKGMEGVGTLTLMDLTGKLLITKQVTANEFVSVSDVASGIYTLRITVHGGSTNRKLVIN